MNIISVVSNKKLKIYIAIAIGLIILYLNNKQEKTLKVISTQVTNKTIIIDAGHGLPDEGAVGFKSLTEEKINLQIAIKLQKLLESSGSVVRLTRSDENGIYNTDAKTIRNKKVSDIKNRVNLINNMNNQILVSIHLNKFSDSKYRGWQVFYKENNVESELLANKIQQSINKNINISNKRTTKPIRNIYIIDKSKIPSVIVECGFISNKEEATLLQKEDYQDKLVWGIYIGIQEYFKENK